MVLATETDESGRRMGGSKEAIKKKKFRMKEAVSQLTCLFCLVGHKNNSEESDSTEENARGDGICRESATIATTVPTALQGDLHKLDSEGSSFHRSVPNYYSDGSQQGGNKVGQALSPKSIMDIFDVSGLDYEQVAHLSATTTSSLNKDESFAASTCEEARDNNQDALDIDMSVRSAPETIGGKGRQAPSPTTRIRKLLIKPSKSVNFIDRCDESPTHPPKAIPISIGLENLDDMSAIGDLHPEDMRQVNGLAWVQNPEPDNAAYYSGPALFGVTPHGKGRMLFANGDTYQGPFNKGKMQGTECTYSTQNGTIFKGSFHRNVRHGHGETKVGSMVRYVGGYYHGIPHGYGEAYNIDGSIFHRGQFEKGMPAHKYYPYIRQGDDVSMASALIQIACDVSLASTVGPRVSRYDEKRTLLGGDDSSVGSAGDESCFSDLTDIPSSGLAFPPSSSEARDAQILDQGEEVSVYEKTGSILSLEPVNQLTAESLQRHMGVADKKRYESLGPAFGRYDERIDRALTTARSINKMNPSTLYGRRLDL